MVVVLGEAICENGFEDMPGHYFSGRCYATSAIRDQETAGMVAPICVRYSPQQGQMLSIYDSSVNKFVQKLLKDGKMQASWIGLSVSSKSRVLGKHFQLTIFVGSCHHQLQTENFISY